MKITSLKSSGHLPPPDMYTAELREVKEKSEGRKLLLLFKLDGFDDLVPKEVIASFDSGSLRADLETLQGVPFNDADIKGGVDPVSFIGTKCRAVVTQKRASGGRTIAIVSVILPSTKQSDALAVN